MSLKAIDEFLLLSRLYQTNEATFATYTVLSYAPSTLSRRCKTPMNFSFQVKRAVMFNISEHRRWINWCDKIVHLSRYLYYKYKHFQDRRRNFFTNKSEKCSFFYRSVNYLIKFYRILIKVIGISTDLSQHIFVVSYSVSFSLQNIFPIYLTFKNS